MEVSQLGESEPEVSLELTETPKIQHKVDQSCATVSHEVPPKVISQKPSVQKRLKVFDWHWIILSVLSLSIAIFGASFVLLGKAYLGMHTLNGLVAQSLIISQPGGLKAATPFVKHTAQLSGIQT